ncbi:MAG: GNAT family N-acetyltransferase [Pseudomonadota bacterium]
MNSVPNKTHKNILISELSDKTLCSFQNLFFQSFNHTMEKNVWQWKYQLSPAHSLGFWRGHNLQGHYGGFPRKIMFFGQEKKALQVGDTMTAPGVRGVLTKNGVFKQLAHSFLQRYIGFDAPYLLGFGFPTTRVMKLAVKLGLYFDAGKFTRLALSVPQTTQASWLYKIRPVSISDSKAVDQLWHRMAKQTSDFIIGVRDWQHINYRYLTSPLHEYHVLKLNHRLTKQLIAVVVLRTQDNECLIIDFVCSLKHTSLAIDSALRFASLQKSQTLSVLISSNLKSLFSSRKFSETNPEISIPHCACTAGPDLKQIKNKWWLMAGDSDCM